MIEHVSGMPEAMVSNTSIANKENYSLLPPCSHNASHLTPMRIEVYKFPKS